MIRRHHSLKCVYLEEFGPKGSYHIKVYL
uniref:Uncharacterized protein n=1 Tax=Arundo donax TaxID=35708 RepID=A0A0A8XYN8_ARUDO